jgi:hypothetical protein
MAEGKIKNFKFSEQDQKALAKLKQALGLKTDTETIRAAITLAYTRVVVNEY